MIHPAQHSVFNDRQLPAISFGVICAIAVALLTPSARAQRGGSHFGGAARHSMTGMRNRPFGGAPRSSFPRGYSHIPASLFQTPESIGGSRLRLQCRRGTYLGYGVWPLYGWASSWAPDCAAYSTWDCYGNYYSGLESGEPAPWLSGELGLNSVLVIYLRDGSGYGVTDYWVADGKLNFVTTYNSEKSVPFENVNWQRTVDDNAARGLYFTLRYSPSKQRYKPNIPPACPASSTEKTGTVSSRPAIGEAQLFGATVSATDQGSKVTLVRAGSPAAQAGINPGDVVLRIDCQQVHSGSDIESAIAANISGAPWVSYLIKGAWLSEQQIKVR